MSSTHGFRLGIDFGTSFSLPATSFMGDETILLPSGVYGVPSVFYYDEDEDIILIGQEAEDAGQGEQAKNLKREIKMELNSTFRVGEKNFTGKQIVGYILAKIKEIALTTARQKLIEAPLEGVIISVPPAFEHNEKLFIKQAASIPVSEGGPGLKVLGFIKEPVAAALAYFKEPLVNQTKVLVYDFGGGTCDVAVVEAKDTLDERFVVRASKTLRIGGKNWDAKLAEYIACELENQGLTIHGNKAYEEKVLRAAIKAKHDFSEKLGNKYRDRVRARVEIDGQLKQVPITRETLNRLTEGLLQKTINMVKEVLAMPECKGVDTIICVGGSSNMPQVRQALENNFLGNGIKDIKLYEPEKAIAVGAAIYAAHFDADDISEGNRVSDKAYLRDIASYSYGVRTHYHGGPEKVWNLIRIGMPLPVVIKDEVFHPLEDNQSSVRFPIYESELDKEICELSSAFTEGDVDDSNRIMDIDLPLPPRTPKGTDIFVTMKLTIDGIIEVIADDHKGHKIMGRKELNWKNQITK